VAYNPRILQEALQARRLTRDGLAQRLGKRSEELDRELDRSPEPRQSLLNDIAKELALPEFAFFMNEALPLQDLIPDFRSAKPAPSPKSKSTVKSIQFAAAIQEAAVEFQPRQALALPKFEANEPGEVEDFALRMREFFGISIADQAQSENANGFYNICRKKIEEKGVFVIQDTFPENDGSGFCLAHPSHPIVVVNTKRQTRGRRLFTLIHELAHVLMGKSGISDPFVSKNSTERKCNLFAASFLVPGRHAADLLRGAIPVPEPDLSDVAWASRRLKISQQATVLRLEQLGFYKVGTYEKWCTAIHNLGNPDFSEGGGGAAGPPPQEKVKLAKYGFQFAETFYDMLQKGLISEINLFRATGLKPKYQRPYFEYAKSVSEEDIRALDLGDG
jgi:Zn-dependent peptidase ImmA (M78 family)